MAGAFGTDDGGGRVRVFTGSQALITGGLLLALGGCTAAAQPIESIVVAKVGDCRSYSYADGNMASTTAPLVDCQGKHNAQTFSVATLPEEALEQVELMWVRDESGDEASTSFSGALASALLPCTEQLDPWLGAKEGYLPHRFTVNWFVPGREDWARGDRTLRCDVRRIEYATHAHQETDYLAQDLPVPDMSGYLGGTPAVEWASCSFDQSDTATRTVDCRHRGARVLLAVREASGDTFPGAKKMKKATFAWCAKESAAHSKEGVDGGYWASWPSKSSWKVGSRVQRCYSDVEDWDRKRS